MKLYLLFFVLIGLFKPFIFEEQTDDPEKSVKEVDTFELVRSEMKLYTIRYLRALEKREKSTKIVPADYQLEYKLLSLMLERDKADLSKDNSELESSLKSPLAMLMDKLDKLVAKVNDIDANLSLLKDDANKLCPLVTPVQEKLDKLVAKVDGTDKIILQLKNDVSKLSPLVTSEAQKLQDLWIPFKNCYVSGNRGLIRLPNGREYYYRRKEGEYTWNDAKEFCEKRGMTMVTIYSAQELLHFKSSNPGYNYWVAAVKGSNGSFFWENGDPVEHSWLSKLDQGTKKTCLFMNEDILTDRDCSKKCRPFCERPRYCYSSLNKTQNYD